MTGNDRRPIPGDAGRTALRRVPAIAGLALAYFIAGQLGLLLAIPPGYATAVWPASGLALAAMLLHGYRLWPGVVLGSFAVNVATSFDSSSTATIVGSLALALNVGVGAALQALVGAWTTRRAFARDPELLTAGSVLFVLGLGGPVSCVISATWGVGTLSLCGLITAGEFAFSWMTWWVGDTIGVMLMVPVALCFAGRPATAWRPRRIRVVGPLAIALIVVTSVFIAASGEEQDRIDSEFDERASIVGDALQRELSRTIEVLYSSQSLFALAEAESAPVSREQFRKYVQRALQRNPCIHALSWNVVVDQPDREAFESRIRAEGLAGFAIWWHDGAGVLSAQAEHDRYVVVTYIEPLAANEKALGYDVNSDPTRRAALEAAAATGDPVATEPVQLIQETGSQRGVLFFLPVYRDGVPPEAAARRDLVKGFVVGVFRTEDLLAGALGESGPANILVRLSDVSTASGPVLMASAQFDEQGGRVTVDDREGGDPSRTLRWETTIRVGGRSWRMEVDTTPRYLAFHRSWMAWSVLTGGLLFTALLGGFLLVITGQGVRDQGRTELLLEEVAQRERAEQALQDVNRRLESLATTDALTQVHNRRSIQEISVILDDEARRYGSRYAVMMVDIDHFKDVNDRFGHQVGDRVLCEVARRLELQMRASDHIGRWGGEEFVILARHSGVTEAVTFAERLRVAIDARGIDPVGRVTVSIGVTCVDREEGYADALARADKAMYAAKSNGRNRVERAP
ncbi:MAG: CHASE domain-containing protein [Planctomycetes bacterium]|nr:CHASE domain-containing protein [Planctomycetota bacterium]